MPFSEFNNLQPSYQIPLSVPNLDGNERKYLEECISSNFVSSVGPFVTKFEKQLSHHLGSRFVVATNSGTSAIHLMLIAAGVRSGDLVIIPSYSFIATANAVSMAGATPWFVDIEEESWGLDPELLSQELNSKCSNSHGELVHKETKKRVAAILAVYAAGHPPRVSDIAGVAEAFGVPLVFDAAAAIGSKFNGVDIGQLGFPHALSFNGNKIITSGGGGAVILDDENSAQLIRHLSTTARTDDGYSHDAIAYNYRLTNVHAAIGFAQLERLDSLLESKRRIFRKYDEAFEDLCGGHFPNVMTEVSSHWVSGIILNESHKNFCSLLIAELGKNGIQAREFWRPIHSMKPYLGCPASEMTVTNSLVNRVIVLPNSTCLSKDDQDRVIKEVRHLVFSLQR